MKPILVNRHMLFDTLLADLWDPAFGPVPSFGVRVSPEDAVACPEDQTAISRYAVLRQLEAVDKKARDRDLGIDPILVERALDKRRVIENQLSSWSLPQSNADMAPFLRARDIIHSVLCPLDRVWEEVFHDCGFGPGAVFHSKGLSGRSLLEKIAGSVHTCTPKLRSLVLPVISDFFPNWADCLKECGNLELVRGNRIAFVHKDKEKCRTIAVEPSMNMFVQKGIGSYLMKTLKLHLGIDLRDQSKNRDLALSGSIDGAIATIDLSDASDRICTNLVRWLLPGDWFALLDAARSPETRLPDGTWVRNEAFSSQGNGFTFPLETLIFYALSEGARQHGSKQHLSCYGDDIIVPACDYEGTVKVLRQAGFEVNLAKSFCEGGFRESCGGDYLYGQAVRPVYYKDEARNFSQVAGLHNLLMETWGANRLPKTLAYLWNLVPEGKRLIGPRRFWATKFTESYWNTLSTPYTSYFWDERWYERISCHFDKDLQTFVYSIKEWGMRNVPLPVELLEQLPGSGKLLAFLYAGSEFINSPASKPCTRTRQVSAREV